MENNNTTESTNDMSSPSGINSERNSGGYIQQKEINYLRRETLGTKTASDKVSEYDNTGSTHERGIQETGTFGNPDSYEESGTSKSRGSGFSSSARQTFDASVNKFQRYKRRLCNQPLLTSCVEFMDWLVFTDEDEDEDNMKGGGGANDDECGKKKTSSILCPTRIKVFRFVFFIIFSFDIALNVNKANMYDATLIDIPHFNLFRYLPPVSPVLVTILWATQSYIAFWAAFGLQARWHIPLLAILNTYTYFCSRIDSYQHHYLLWWILVILSTVNWDSKKLKAWPFRLILVQLSFVYFFAGITKLDYLFRVQEVLPMQMNMLWLHKIVYVISAFMGFSNDHFIWWLIGFGVVVLEFFLSFAIHTNNETVRTIAWVSGGIFHTLANMSSLHIRMFSYYMFAFYIIMAPDYIIRILYNVMPSTLCYTIIGFLNSIIQILSEPEDDDDVEKKENEKETKMEESKAEAEPEPEAEAEKNRPDWKKKTLPPGRRKPERAGWCARITFLVLCSLLCLVQLGPAFLRLLAWFYLFWLTIMRPRKLTRIRHIMFGNPTANRLPVILSIICLIFFGSWYSFALQSRNFPYYDRVAPFTTALWIFTSIRTPYNRTYYTAAHLCHCVVLGFTNYGKL